MCMTFKPSRREVRDVQRFAHEVEVHASAYQRLSSQGQPNSYGHVAEKYSERAFSLSESIAKRGAE